MDYSTGVFDKDGIEIRVGHVVEEKYVMSNGHTFGRAVGVIRYISGCHCIVFNNNGGVFTLFDRHPEAGLMYSRIWTVIGDGGGH